MTDFSGAVKTLVNDARRSMDNAQTDHLQHVVYYGNKAIVETLSAMVYQLREVQRQLELLNQKK